MYRNRDRANSHEHAYAIRSYGPRRPIKCLRCDTSSHSGYDCPRRDVIVCFRCRAPGQKMPSCENCKAKAAQDIVSPRDKKNE